MATTPITAADVTIGRNLYLLRRAAKLDQRQLAAALAEQGFPIASSTLSRTETGKRAVPAAEVHALAAFFGVKPRDLTGGATKEEAPSYSRFDERPAPRLQLAPALMEVELPAATAAAETVPDAAGLAVAVDRLTATIRSLVEAIMTMQAAIERAFEADRAA